MFPSVEAQEPKPPQVIDAEFRHKGKTISVTAERLIEYADGSMLLQADDGQLWTVKGEDFVSTVEVPGELKVLSMDEAYERFKEELPEGFSVYKTKNYVLVYNTSKAYVQWVGQLFESIHRSFANYWRSRGVRLEEPRFPMVALVFSDRASYLRYAKDEIGESANSMIGYYNMKTNRMVMYDLTGVDGMVPGGRRVSTAAVINQVLRQPKAERTVATVVHEAVHQLAYNRGLQVRLADNPFWLSEGMAMFFEAPDPRSRTGWGGIGNINYHNLRLFMQDLPSRPAGRLKELLTDDTKFQQGTSAGQFYAESWALTYYLMKTKGKQYSAYVKELRALPPLGESKPAERMEVFERHFGSAEELDKEFIQYIGRLR